MKEHAWGKVTLCAAAVAALYALAPGTTFPPALLSWAILVAALVALRTQQVQHDTFPREWAGYVTAYVCWGAMGALSVITDAPAARLVAGAGIALGYVVFAYAIVWFHRTRVVGVDRDWMLDSTVVLTALGVGLWTTLDVTRTAAEQLSSMEQAAVAIAALIHLSFVTLAARLLTITRWRAIRPYFGTSAGVLSAAGSAVYFVARVEGAAVPLTAYALWTLGAVALAAVPLLPPAPYLRADHVHDPRPFARFAVLATSLVVGIAAVLWSQGVSIDETVPTGGALLLSLLVLWRMHGLVTANEQAKRQLERLAAQQATLAELGRRSLARTDVATFMSWASERIRTALQVDRCEVMELDPDGRNLLIRTGGDQPAATVGTTALAMDAALPPCHAAATGELVHVPDVRADDRFDDPTVGAGAAPVASVSARISGTDGTYGVLLVGMDRPYRFTGDDLEFVSGAADVLAVAVDRILREARIRYASLHDPLTGLPNRTLLFDRLDHALAGASRRTGKVALLFIDLDGFKQVNDELGHASGDQLLVEVAERLCGVVRVSDTVSRFGGDEFVLLADDVQDDAAARRIARNVAAALEAPFRLQGRLVEISGSVGIATADPGETADELLRRADAAMYRAKGRGRAHLELAVPAAPSA